jgi:hypothetical protein
MEKLSKLSGSERDIPPSKLYGFKNLVFYTILWYCSIRNVFRVNLGIRGSFLEQHKHTYFITLVNVIFIIFNLVFYLPPHLSA